MNYLVTLFPLARSLALNTTVFLGLSACQSPATTPTEITSGQKPTLVQAERPAAEAEHITWAMLIINGKPYHEVTTQQLLTQAGRPDSIGKGVVECGSLLTSLNKPSALDGDCWYYGKSTYDVGGTQAVLSSFDATTSKFSGQVGSLALNQHTTLTDVQHYFPTAAQQAQAAATHTEGWDKVVHLPFYKKGVSEEVSLELFFNRGQLQKVSFYSPC